MFMDQMMEYFTPMNYKRYIKNLLINVQELIMMILGLETSKISILSKRLIENFKIVWYSMELLDNVRCVKKVLH